MGRFLLLLSVIVAVVGCGGLNAAGRTKAPLSLPRQSWHIDGYASPDSVERRLSSLPLHDIEGIWSFPGSGAVVAVERSADPSVGVVGVDTYLIVVVRAADRSVRPGTVMGLLRRGSSRSGYEACVFTDTGSRGELKSPRTADITLSDDKAFLRIEPRKSRWRFDPRGLLPYMLRRTVRRESGADAPPVGCYRLYPVPAIPVNPRYL